jgi:hypothetical protein
MSLRAALCLVALAAGAAGAEPTVDARPWFVRSDGGIASPVGFFGLAVGREVAPAWALELGGGLGVTGYQAAVLGRRYLPIGGSHVAFWTLGAGPSLALLGESLGLHVTHRDDIAVAHDDLFHVVGLNAEAGIEARFEWGGLVRVALGGFLKLHDNMAYLCEKDPGSSEEPAGCEAAGVDALPSGAQVARLRAYPYLVFGFGFAW